MEVGVDLTREDCSFIDCEKCPYGDTCDASIRINPRRTDDEY